MNNESKNLYYDQEYIDELRKKVLRDHEIEKIGYFIAGLVLYYILTH